MDRFWLLGALALASALGACKKNPAEGKPQAQVSEASGAVEQAAAEGAPYVFSNEGSTIAFVASKVTQSHDGSFGSFRGSIDLVQGDPQKSRVQVEIDTSSVTTDAAKLTSHLKSPDLLDVAKYPKASFVSTSVKQQAPGSETHMVTGDFELHGAKKAISFPATLEVEAGSLRGKAEFSINRQDFGITYPGMPDDLIKDHVIIKLDIHATPK